MLTLNLGLGYNTFGGASPSAEILFADGAPAGLTETATSTTGTYRDSGGELRATVSTTPIIDYDINGNIIGLQCFVARTNVCTNTNHGNPSTTTNMTLIDLGTGATLTTTTDTVEIPNFKMGDVVNRVYQLYGGSAGAECEISGNIGATGACSGSVVARVLQSGRTCYLGHTNDKTHTVFSNNPGYQRVLAENMTASATTDKLVIKIPAFTTVRFILNQLETGAKASPMIKVSGAAATTVKNFCQMPVVDGFNVDEGVIICEAQALYDTGNANAAGLFVIGSNGSFPTDAYYAQSNQSSNLANGYYKGNNSALNVAASSALIAGRHHPVGMIYNNAGACRTFAGAMISNANTITMPDTATGITTITFGAFAANTWQFNGWIKSLKFFDKAYTMQQVSKYALGTKTGNTERGIVFGGQSNAEGFFSAATVLTNGGERAIISQLNSIWGISTRNWGINGATGGSSLTGWQVTGEFITKWKRIVESYLKAGGTIEAIVWDQGESNMGNTIAWWEDSTTGVLEVMRSFIGGNKPVYIQQGGFYLLNNTDTHKENCYKWKQGHQQIADNNVWAKILPPKIIQPLVDTVHLTDAGYTTQGNIITRFILDDLGETVTDGVTPPTITNAVNGGTTTTTVTITHGSGTDFTIGGVDGWELLDDGMRIETTAAVRTNATTITLTHARAPRGSVWKLRYGMGSGYNHSGGATESPANYVRDNSAPYNLPLFIGEYDVS